MVKYALLIGIEYDKSSKYLPGCMNDLTTVYNLINSWGFSREHMIVLADGTVNKDIFSGMNVTKPTGFNINNALNSFTKMLSPCDKAVIYYTGHGMRTKTSSGKEESCIVPMDYKKTGIVSSESIRYYLNKISPGVNVFCIFDCCNSGTVCNLKYHYYDTSYKKDITLKLHGFNYEDWEFRQNAVKNDKMTSSLNIDTQANIISLSGCWDNQYSFDLGRNGALTLALNNIFKKYSVKTMKFKHLLQDSRCSIMFMKLHQTPQLMCGKDMDLNINIGTYLSVS